MGCVSKWVVCLAIMSAMKTVAQSNENPPGPPGGHGGPPLTDTQKSCLEAQGLPAPGSGTRPDRATVEAAFQACNIAPPAGPPQLTDEQKSCLESQGLPAPGSGTRPDRATVEAAFQACHIALPSGPPPQASADRTESTGAAP